MKNRNAIAVLVSTKLVEAVQAILNVYFHKTLPAFWQTELTSDFATAVVYVGKDGIKGALRRVVAIARRIWAPPSDPSATEAAAPAEPPAAVMTAAKATK